MGYRWAAILLGVFATILFVLSVAVFYNYIPASLVNNFTATELGVFGVIAAVAAVGVEVMERR